MLLGCKTTTNNHYIYSFMTSIHSLHLFIHYIYSFIILIHYNHSLHLFIHYIYLLIILIHYINSLHSFITSISFTTFSHSLHPLYHILSPGSHSFITSIHHTQSPHSSIHPQHPSTRNPWEWADSSVG